MEEIIKKCKCGVYLTVNQNRVYYENVAYYISKLLERGEEIEESIIKDMIVKDTIISLRFYPNTPICFYTVYGSSYDEVIKKSLEILNHEN